MKIEKRGYSSDLRTAKAAATKERIRQAATALHVERRWSDFTLEEVAQRAGTSVQTVLRAFGSKENLFLLANEQAAERGHRGESVPGDIDAAVRILYEDYETIGDQVIRNLAEEPRHPALAPQMTLGREVHRKWVETVFAPQLAAQRGAARQQLLHALIAATDVYLWKLLRRDMKLDRPAAEAVARRMIRALSKE